MVALTDDSLGTTEEESCSTRKLLDGKGKAGHLVDRGRLSGRNRSRQYAHSLSFVQAAGTAFRFFVSVS